LCASLREEGVHIEAVRRGDLKSLRRDESTLTVACSRHQSSGMERENALGTEDYLHVRKYIIYKDTGNTFLILKEES
jgi:hypothetical protein